MRRQARQRQGGGRLGHRVIASHELTRLPTGFGTRDGEG